ncbi:MAG: imidazolonepropionase, partial [Candidatus Brocadiae bacterium]|nr:imidazolonepropionase [Candidatus Brocadiia bacterium]
GIRRSVAQVRAATGAAIVRRARPALRRMLEAGTTTLEIKSGYGLTLPDELKLLRAARTLGKEGAPEVVATFLGAHDVPPEFSADRAGYVRLLCGVMIPAVAKAGLAAWCDVFCERGAFSVEESRAILLAGRAAGLGLRIHAEEFATLGGARLAAELGAASADHLMAIDAAGIEAMRRGGTVATLLPGTTLFLGLSTWAPARALIDAGVPVALATDFNPGSSHIESLQLIWTLAATHLHMTAAECLAASTVNAAHALRIGDRVGRIAPGMQGDMVLWDADDIRLVPYRAGGNSVDVVIKSGRVVVDRQARAAR